MQALQDALLAAREILRKARSSEPEPGWDVKQKLGNFGAFCPGMLGL